MGGRISEGLSMGDTGSEGMSLLQSTSVDGAITFSKGIVQGVEIKVCRSSPHDFKAHVHQELSLGYLVEGSTDLTIRDTTLCYQKGDGIIIPPGVSHLCEPHDIRHWAYVMLFVNPAYYAGRTDFYHPQRLTGWAAERMRHMLDRLLHEQDSGLSENMLIELLLSFGMDEIEPAGLHANLVNRAESRESSPTLPRMLRIWSRLKTWRPCPG